jgi:hypothetical protein
VKGTPQNARFARSDGLESPPDALSSRGIDLCTRTDAKCAREIDRRPMSNDHSSCSTSVRSTKNANRPRAHRVRMASERVLQIEKAVRSFSLRVLATNEPDSSSKNAKSPPKKVVYRGARPSTEPTTSSTDSTSSSTDPTSSSTHATRSSTHAITSSNPTAGPSTDPTSEAA